jgi:hypothetical protein
MSNIMIIYSAILLDHEEKFKTNYQKTIKIKYSSSD